MHYLDHAATTPVSKKVQEVIAQTLVEYGNPSSLYQLGRRSKELMRQARLTIAKSINAQESEILFTASGSEANNLAIQSILQQFAVQKGHLITSRIEHPSVMKVMQYAESIGFEVTYLPVDQFGRVSVLDVKKHLRDNTRLVSIMMINNETGSKQPIAEIGELLSGHPAVFHTDAVQAFGQEAIDVCQLQVDYLSASGHKINAPKGIGFLYHRKTTPLVSLIKGGGQEQGFRAGTENIPYIVGLAQAVLEIEQQRQERMNQQIELITYLQQQLKHEKLSFELNGYHVNTNSTHVVNIWLKGLPSSQVIIMADMAGVCVSAGSACSAGSLTPSPVLRAIYGEEDRRLQESIRLSFGSTSSKEDIDAFIAAIRPLAKRLL